MAKGTKKGNKGGERKSKKKGSGGKSKPVYSYKAPSISDLNQPATAKAKNGEEVSHAPVGQTRGRLIDSRPWKADINLQRPGLTTWNQANASARKRFNRTKRLAAWQFEADKLGMSLADYINYRFQQAYEQAKRLAAEKLEAAKAAAASKQAEEKRRNEYRRIWGFYPSSERSY